MGQNTEIVSVAAERMIKDIRRKTRKRYSTQDKIHIVLAGLRGEDSVAELCRQEDLSSFLRRVIAETTAHLSFRDVDNCISVEQ